MKRRFLAFSLAGLWLATLGFAQSAQDLRSYESLKNPQIRHDVPPRKMLVVEAKGDPNTVGQKAFSLLFRVFFSIQGVRLAPPRARWLTPLSAPKEDWIGLYGLPLPTQIAELPPGSDDARIEVWTYGDIAEILHIGPYSEETPTVERLVRFIDDRGYEIVGPHEEEYIKGPGMAANPADYWTIIRYQVKKK
jgi:hypothetical protein